MGQSKEKKELDWTERGGGGIDICTRVGEGGGGHPSPTPLLPPLPYCPITFLLLLRPAHFLIGHPPPLTAFLEVLHGHPSQHPLVSPTVQSHFSFSLDWPTFDWTPTSPHRFPRSVAWPPLAAPSCVPYCPITFLLLLRLAHFLIGHPPPLTTFLEVLHGHPSQHPLVPPTVQSHFFFSLDWPTF